MDDSPRPTRHYQIRHEKPEDELTRLRFENAAWRGAFDALVKGLHGSVLSGPLRDAVAKIKLVRAYFEERTRQRPWSDEQFDAFSKSVDTWLESKTEPQDHQSPAM